MSSSLTESLLLSREDRLILNCVRNCADSTLGGPGEAEVDWDAVVDRAIGCRVLPQVYTCWESHSQLPVDVAGRMQESTVGFAMHWMALSSAGEEILRALAANDIPVVVLKGAALAPAVYEYPVLRMVGDLDLLLPESRLEAGAAVVRELGFAHEPGEDPGADHHHLPAFYRGPRTRLELHFHVVPPPTLARIPIERLWEDVRLFRLGRTDAKMLSPEHQVVHTCLHAALGHDFHGMLYQLCDLRELVRRFEIHWDSVARDSELFEVSVPVYYALWAAASLTGAEIPPEVTARLRPSGVLRDAWLKCLIPRIALGYDHLLGLPAWVVDDVCAKLLAEASGRKAALQAGTLIVSHLSGGFLRRFQR